MSAHSELQDGETEPITEWPVSSSENQDSIHPAKKWDDSEDEDSSFNNPQLHHFVHKNNINGNFSKRRSSDDCHDYGNKKLKCKDIVFARTALARWWKKEGQHSVSSCDIPQTTNPNTLLHYISRSEAGIDFLKAERESLQSVLDLTPKDGLVCAALGTVEECLGSLTQAKENLQEAVKLDPTNKEYKWHLHKVERQLQVKEHQEKMLQEITGKELELKPLKQVKRVSATELSLQDFFYSYAVTSTPVVITDLVDRMTSTPWTIQHIAEVAGDVLVTLKKPVSQSVEWAGLEDGETVTVGEYIDRILYHEDVEKSDSCLKTDQYLFDWSLPIHCPNLVKELSIPRYFAGDLLQRTSKSSLYQDSWPSLFVANAGLCSQLHVDAFASNFWMALFQGRKRWRFFSPRDVPCLYPRYVHSMDPYFDANPLNPDLDKHPLMSLTQPVQCDLQEGEVLFVPSGCPHHVENLENSVAISANFVDLSNLEAVKHELTVSALVDPRADDLLKQLQDPQFPQNMDSSIGELPWEQFKMWKSDRYDQFDISTKSIEGHKE